MRVDRLLIMLLLASLAVAEVGAGEKFALCVGINRCPEFRLPDGSRAKPLRGAESDAEAMGNVLVERFGFVRSRVHLLLGEHAKLADIRRALESIRSAAHADDLVVFYFAGHGTQVRDVRPLDEEDGLDEALCCYDVTAAGDNLLLDDELGRWLDDLRAKTATIILDSCHSGTGTKEVSEDFAARFLPMPMSPASRPESAGPWSDLRPNTKSLDAPQRIALFACQPAQQAYERRFDDQPAPGRSGQFTRYLLEAIQEHATGPNRDRPIAAAEAIAYVRRRLDASFNSTRPQPADRQEPLVERTGPDRPLFELPRR